MQRHLYRRLNYHRYFLLSKPSTENSGVYQKSYDAAVEERLGEFFGYLLFELHQKKKPLKKKKNKEPLEIGAVGECVSYWRHRVSADVSTVDAENANSAS